VWQKAKKKLVPVGDAALLVRDAAFRLMRMRSVTPHAGKGCAEAATAQRFSLNGLSGSTRSFDLISWLPGLDLIVAADARNGRIFVHIFMFMMPKAGRQQVGSATTRLWDPTRALGFRWPRLRAWSPEAVVPLVGGAAASINGSAVIKPDRCNLATVALFPHLRQ
jgi:hypothetical protein